MNVCVAGRSKMVWGCRQDTHCTTSVAALQPNQPTCSLHPRAFETAASASHSFTRTNGALHCSMLEGSRPNYFRNILHGIALQKDEWFSSIVPGLILLPTTDPVAVTKRWQGNVAFQQLHNSIHIIVYQFLTERNKVVNIE